MTQYELDKINAERRKRNLPPLTMSQARDALDKRRRKSNDDDSFDTTGFLIGYLTGVPMPSTGGIIGAAVSPVHHHESPAPTYHHETPTYSPPSTPSTDSSSPSSDAGSSGGGDW